jgi:hypothetical protein
MRELLQTPLCFQPILVWGSFGAVVLPGLPKMVSKLRDIVMARLRSVWTDVHRTHQMFF